MNSQRARQILQSPETIYVTYKNIPVWIDEVKNDNRAGIRDMNSNTSLEVPVDELLEIGSLKD